ncbi:MAG: phosphatase PAP2 family protein [bacterium]
MTDLYPTPRREPRRLGTKSIQLGVLSLAALAACAKVGEDVLDKETAPFDVPIRAWMLTRRTRGLDRFFVVVTNVGAPSALIPITAAAALWLRAKGGLPIAAAVVLAPTIAVGLFVGIKQAYRRARPAGARTLHQRTYSFPSGHASASAAIGGTLAYVLWRERMIAGPAAAVLATVPTLLIGTSRVYLDVHWPTDVLGGWALGALVTALSAITYEHIRTDTRKRGAPALARWQG